jgi:hypothetical protein
MVSVILSAVDQCHTQRTGHVIGSDSHTRFWSLAASSSGGRLGGLEATASWDLTNSSDMGSSISCAFSQLARHKCQV